jgi:hypothetical protein
MNVSQLIELLKKCPPHLRVVTSNGKRSHALLHYTYPGLDEHIRLIDEDMKNLVKLKHPNHPGWKIIE